MAIKWNVSQDYSTYSVEYASRTWLVFSTATETHFSFDLYDEDLNLIHTLPSKGGLYLALDFAEGLITRKFPESLAGLGNS